jgi:limonene-1,2-epoxide hydrolase
MTADESRQWVLSFLNAWRDRNLDHLLSFFASDAVYHNVPVAPIVGQAAIRDIFAAFLREFRTASLDVVTAVAEPGLVIAERVDRFESNTGRRIELPVTGVFVLAGGKIARFSDYFDLASFERQSGMKL